MHMAGRYCRAPLMFRSAYTQSFRHPNHQYKVMFYTKLFSILIVTTQAMMLSARWRGCKKGSPICTCHFPQKNFLFNGSFGLFLRKETYN